jgi:capsular exopolysaccharide synthesis family protein
MAKELWIQTQPLSGFSQAIRTMRESLFTHLKDKKNPVITMCAPRRGDGCSTISANLAASIAHTGMKTLIIDADLQSHGLDEFFGAKQEGGFIDAILGKSCKPSATGFENLHYLQTGVSPDSMHPLDSPRANALLDSLQGSYNFIMIDTAPVLETSDPVVLGQKSTALVLVFRSGSFLRDDEISAREMLIRSGVKILGIVVNRILEEDRDRYYTYQKMLERIEQ